MCEKPLTLIVLSFIAIAKKYMANRAKDRKSFFIKEESCAKVVKLVRIRQRGYRGIYG